MTLLVANQTDGGFGKADLVVWFLLGFWRTAKLCMEGHAKDLDTGMEKTQKLFFLTMIGLFTENSPGPFKWFCRRNEKEGAVETWQNNGTSSTP